MPRIVGACGVESVISSAPLSFSGWLPAAAVVVAERDAWRHEAEVACLKSGPVKEGPLLARVEPIEGPGICGADFPLKVAAIGEGAPIGFAEDLRPPGSVPQPLAAPPGGYRRPSPDPYRSRRIRSPLAGIRPNRTGPMPIRPPAAEPDEDDTNTRARPVRRHNPIRRVLGKARMRLISRCLMSPRRTAHAAHLPSPIRTAAAAGLTRNGSTRSSYPPAEQVPLGRERGPVTTGAVASAAHRDARMPDRVRARQLVASGVQPAAMKWFGVQVAEIRQISAYSCRGMNGSAARKSPSTRSAMRSTSHPSRSPTAARSRSRTAGAALRRSRASCATCRRRPASTSPRCSRPARTSITTTTSTWT